VLDAQSPDVQFMAHAQLICAFEQPRPQSGVYFHGGTHDLARDVVDFHTGGFDIPVI